MSHTPGPWRVDRYDIMSPDGHMIATTRGILELSHEEANARLIASAPDLLAACEAMLKAWDGDYFDKYAVYPIRDAVAKASATPLAGTTPR